VTIGGTVINEVFGWLWILVGFAAGALLGIGFERTEWLSGYGSLRRRMLRLGHIALIALGFLNILFAHSLGRIDLAPMAVRLASWALVLGAVTMPLCCALMAWRPGFKPLFCVPVLSLILGAALTAWGLWP
jgi:hypothetical protein